MSDFHAILIDVVRNDSKYRWPLVCSRARAPEADGLWILFPSKHNSKFNLFTFVKKKITDQPIPWLTIGDLYWLIDVDQVKLAFESEKQVGGNASWPGWLKGVIEVEPEFEIGESTNRMSLRITKEAYRLAEQRKSAEAKNSSTVVQHFYAEAYMGTQNIVTGGQVGAVGENSRADGKMGDTFVNHGQVGQLGHNATGNTNYLMWEQSAANMDFEELSGELAALRRAMREHATELAHDQAIVAIGQAEAAAIERNGNKVLESLRAAGKWALDVATKIGVPIAVKAIETATGVL